MRCRSWEEFFVAQRDTLVAIEEEVRRQRERRPTLLPGGDQLPASAVYPPPEDVFRAFELTPLDQVRVVILGQDPYHGPGQAHGLAFSYAGGGVLPPSLVNVLVELSDDVGDVVGSRVRKAVGRERGDLEGDVAAPVGDLSSWARRGVLLLNTALTVLEASPGSHMRLWRPFTNEVIWTVVDSSRSLLPVFVLWGKPARQTFERVMGELHPYPHGPAGLLRAGNTYAFASSHPSPLSAKSGFFGSRPFSRVNELLVSLGEQPVDWRLP